VNGITKEHDKFCTTHAKAPEPEPILPEDPTVPGTDTGNSGNNGGGIGDFFGNLFG
jgi:hypothetical protein